MRLWPGLLVFGALAPSVNAQERELPAPTGALIDVAGGRRLHLHCTGRGEPTVVFEAGASSFAIDFTLVQRELEKTHRVCSYDRAGMGWSDPAGESRVSAARDMHDLLVAAGERPPYILVGASRGGLFIRDYRAAYPRDVAGMVFLDPSTESRLFWQIGDRIVAVPKVTEAEMRATVPTRPVAVPRRKPQTGAPFDRLPPELYQVRILLDERLIASVPDTVTPRMIESAREDEWRLLVRLDSIAQSRSQALDSIPVVVLSREDTQGDREVAHGEVARQSRNGYQCAVPRAGHEIHLFRPDVVLRAVREVAQSVRANAPLTRAACGSGRAQ